MLNVMAGYHSSDRTTVPRPSVDFVEAVEHDLEGLRIGVIENDSVLEASSEQMLAVLDLSLIHI